MSLTLDSGRPTVKRISWMFPRCQVSTIVLGDSQTKYLHQHFDPVVPGTPAFVSLCGALIDDVHNLLDFIPDTAQTVIIHVGTNDLASSSGRFAFKKYCSLLEAVIAQHPNVRRIYVSLILPRSENRRRKFRNRAFIRRCNREACHLNFLLRNHCRFSRQVFFIDHGLEWLPPSRTLCMDGLHPNFEGVALIASHIRRLCGPFPRSTPSSWRDSSSVDALPNADFTSEFPALPAVSNAHPSPCPLLRLPVDTFVPASTQSSTLPSTTAPASVTSSRLPSGSTLNSSRVSVGTPTFGSLGAHRQSSSLPGPSSCAPPARTNKRLRRPSDSGSPSPPPVRPNLTSSPPSGHRATASPPSAASSGFLGNPFVQCRNSDATTLQPE